MKRLLSAFLVGMMVFATGCSDTKPAEQKADKKQEQKNDAQEKSGTFKFYDSVGREVELSSKIDKIAPSGYIAQIMLYSIAPDKMVGWGQTPKEKQMKYIDEKYTSLPEFGAFYGKNANLNMEALVKAQPQIVIDLGEPKDDIKDGMDTIQKQTNIPTVFIDAKLENLPQAYTTLGEILDEKEQGKSLAEYCQKALDDAKMNSEKVTTKPRIFYAEGENGLSTMGAGSIHSQSIEMIGAENVAKLEKGSKSGSEVSMEQLMNWNPDIIIASDKKVYELINTDETWKTLKAVKDKKVYQIPSQPYGWIGRPPSVNRILGMQWLGNIIFPENYKYDMVKQAQEFYKLFYHYDLTQEEAKEMLKNS